MPVLLLRVVKRKWGGQSLCYILWGKLYGRRILTLEICQDFEVYPFIVPGIRDSEKTLPQTFPKERIFMGILSKVHLNKCHPIDITLSLTMSKEAKRNESLKIV